MFFLVVLNRLDSSVGRDTDFYMYSLSAGGRGFAPRMCHTKNDIKW